jgi:spore coat polysaccharide biosynthesis protein SpsF
MEVGQLNKKIGFIIQARMGSDRLPGKTLMSIPLASEVALLLRIINSLKKTKLNYKIVVATSNSKENDSIVEFCEKNRIDFYRGDEEHVLSRFIAVNKKNNFDCIVRLTGDNPILDIKILDNVIKSHLKNKNDYTKTNNLPLGMNFEVLSPNSLDKMEDVELKDEQEHVTLHIVRSEKFRKETISFNIPQELTDLRLTVDYASDFILISTVIDLLERLNIEGIKGIQEIYSRYPWIFSVNNQNIQKLVH